VRRGLLTAGLLLVAAGLGACGAEEPSHREIGRDAWALRAAFNADAGRVRVVVLVAPT
jgi:hypothetical protein